MKDLIVYKLTNCDTNDEYYSYTVDDDGECLTVLMLDGNIIGIFKHIAVHDRFYCDSLYGFGWISWGGFCKTRKSGLEGFR